MKTLFALAVLLFYQAPNSLHEESSRLFINDTSTNYGHNVALLLITEDIKAHRKVWFSLVTDGGKLIEIRINDKVKMTLFDDGTLTHDPDFKVDVQSREFWLALAHFYPKVCAARSSVALK